MKMVIYRKPFGWEVTSRENYDSPVRDARKVYKFSCKEWDSERQIVSYLCNFCLNGVTESDFEHIGGKVKL